MSIVNKIHNVCSIHANKLSLCLYMHKHKSIKQSNAWKESRQRGSKLISCDETGMFFGKKMPNCTYIMAEEKKLPRHKPMKEH